MHGLIYVERPPKTRFCFELKMFSCCDDREFCKNKNMDIILSSLQVKCLYAYFIEDHWVISTIYYFLATVVQAL